MKLSKRFLMNLGFKKTATRDEIIRILMQHPLLEELRAWMTFRSKTMNIEDAVKKNMTKYYVGLLFSNCYDMTIHCINHFEQYSEDNTDINNLLMDTVGRVRDIATDNGVPVIFLDKISNYLYRQTKLLTSTYADVNRYETRTGDTSVNASKLDMGLLLVRCIASQIETVINDMNGELHAALKGSVFDK